VGVNKYAPWRAFQLLIQLGTSLNMIGGKVSEEVGGRRVLELHEEEIWRKGGGVGGKGVKGREGTNVITVRVLSKIKTTFQNGMQPQLCFYFLHRLTPSLTKRRFGLPEIQFSHIDLSPAIAWTAISP